MSTNPQAPGVYVNFMPSGTQPIEGVATAITAFIGFTEKAELIAEDGRSTVSARNKAILVTSWDQYVKHFGSFIECAYTPNAVKGYFDNGGKIAYIISILNDKMLQNDDVKQSMKLHHAQLLLQTGDPQNPTPTLLVRAKNHGDEGNSIAIAIEHVPDSTDKFNLFVWNAKSEAPIELLNLTMDVNDKEHSVEKVNSNAALKKIIEVEVFERTGDPSKKRPKESTKPEFLEGGESFKSQLALAKDRLSDYLSKPEPKSLISDKSDKPEKKSQVESSAPKTSEEVDNADEGEPESSTVADSDDSETNHEDSAKVGSSDSKTSEEVDDGDKDEPASPTIADSDNSETNHEDSANNSTPT